MLLFFVGVVEMVIISAWTKVVVETKVLVSGLITLANVMIWYFVLNTVIQDITNWGLIAEYALGCAIGTMATTAYFARVKTKKLRLKKKQANESYEKNIARCVR